MTRRLVSLLCSLGGLALLAWILRAIGLDVILDGLARVGRGLPVILILSLARHTVRAYAWTQLMDEPVPLAAALRATISGDAFGNVTPLGPLASEPAKSAYLAGIVPASRSFPALMAENVIYGISMALYVSLGAIGLLAAAAGWANDPSRGPMAQNDAMHMAGLVTLAAMGVLVLLIFVVAWRRPAALSSLFAWLPGSWTDQHIDRVQRFETHTYDLVRSGMRRLVAAETAFHVLSFAEAWFTLWLLTGTSMPTAALVLDSVNRVINVAFKLIPLRAGVDEYAAAIVSSGVGVRPDVAIVLALVRKLRLLIWAVAGLGIWARR